MSVNSEITRLNTAKTDIKTAIEGKGVTVPSSAKLDDYADYVEQIQQGGGGSGSVVEKDINFYNYDGTRLYSYTFSEIQALSSLPQLPNVAGFTASSWTTTLQEIKSYNKRADIGVNFNSNKEETEIDIIVDYDTYKWKIFAWDALYIDWGDGRTTTTQDDWSWHEHTYSSRGTKTISVRNAVSGQTYNLEGIISGSGSTEKNNPFLYPSVIENFSNIYDRKIYEVKEIRIGNKCRALGEGSGHTFRNYIALEKIVLPTTLTEIGSNCFNGNKNLKAIVFPSSLTNYESDICNGCVSLERAILSNSATVIKGYTFYGCTNLKSIVLPDSTTNIEGDAFRNCYNLETVISHNPSLITSIENYAFADCISLRKIDIPLSGRLWGNCFNGCTSLESKVNNVISLSNNLTVDNYSFNNCKNIINIYANCTTIKNSVFYGCNNLYYITIGSSVTSIGTYAFYGCCMMTLNIPNSVTSIGAYAFYKSSGYLDVDMNSNTPPTLGINAFGPPRSALTISVPYSSDHSVLNAYKSATNWSDYANYIYERSND